MRKLMMLTFAALAAAAVAKSPIDLMNEGRYNEARAILDSTSASPRYRLLLNAMTQSDGAVACSLYRVVSATYPNTDCDSVALARLEMARVAGFTGRQPAPKPTAESDHASVASATNATPSQTAAPVAQTANAESKDRTAEHAAVGAVEDKSPSAVSGSKVESDSKTSSRTKRERTKIASTSEAGKPATTEKPKTEQTTDSPTTVEKPKSEPVSPKAQEQTPPPEKPKVDTEPVVVAGASDAKSAPVEKVTPEVQPPSAEKKTAVPATSNSDQPAQPKSRTKSETNPEQKATPKSAAESTQTAGSESKSVPPVPPKPEKKRVADAEKTAQKSEPAKPRNAAVKAEEKVVPGAATETPAPPVKLPAIGTDQAKSKPDPKSLPKSEESAPQPKVEKPAPKEDAAQADSKLKEKSAAQSEKSGLTSSATPGAWFIQVGAFGNHDNARHLASSLQSAGYGVKLVSKTANDKELLQVRVGGYSSKADCLPVADQLKSKFNVPAVIIME